MKAFGFKTLTTDRVPVLVGGLFNGHINAETVQDAVRKYTLGRPRDAFLLDYQLMRMLKSVCSSFDIFAAGASAYCPDLQEHGGGVIGSLRGYEPQPYIAEPVSLGLGFSVFSLPGRFGLVCPDDTAHQIASDDTSMSKPELFCRLSGQNFLLVADGSGPEADGILCAKGDGQQMITLVLTGDLSTKPEARRYAANG